MQWSFKLGKFFGIDVFVHVTFVLLLGFIGLSHWLETRQLSDAALGVAFFLALFACVLLHELGHALMARRYGITTRDITLLPIGGLARLERIPDKPMQEFWVALAGPAVNGVIALILIVYLTATSSMAPLSTVGVTGGSFLTRLAMVNLMLIGFNLLPAFPMDGGRVVRALLATRMDYARATHIAARLGQAMALVFGFVGLFSNPFLIFIALFVWIGAQQEAGIAQWKSALVNTPAQAIMITDFRSLSPDDTLDQAVEHVLSGFQQDFPVVDERDQLVGVLTRSSLIRALTEAGTGARVGDAMRRDIAVASPFEMAEDVLTRLQECQCHSMPVVKNGRVVGLLNAENLGEFLMITRALQKRESRQNFG